MCKTLLFLAVYALSANAAYSSDRFEMFPYTDLVISSGVYRISAAMIDKSTRKNWHCKATLNSAEIAKSTLSCDPGAGDVSGLSLKSTDVIKQYAAQSPVVPNIALFWAVEPSSGLVEACLLTKYGNQHCVAGTAK